MTRVVEVAAAILLRDLEGGSEFLLAQRPQGKAYAGYWEFPGGKVEPGETLRQALVRELQEELGVGVDCAWPWLSCAYTYPHASVRLKFFRVSSWHGQIAPIEHSGLVWMKAGDSAPVAPILPANGPILRALELPSIYALSNAAGNGIDAELAKLECALAGRLRLIQVRDKTLPPAQRLDLARRVMTLANQHAGACVLINDDEVLAREVGAHGLHLSSGRLMQLTRRPAFDRVGASCHSAQELAHAAALELDFAVLSPVLPTASHPGAQGMGWDEFARLIERSPLPVYALGGMQPEMLDTARERGAHGIALMRGWNPRSIA
ncbi:MAG: Nudix family hydrolase [Propionivibrio sp.]|uniref:8-oxo-dGTP diphosphatase n=1 Tax=Candidatus Propionivibrio dominans TaxID=2954373 RepID=A0A9D7FES2_9RHOO|nr:Nudix family hydrolase [Candidatus Propionivibrio dominans]